MADTRRRRVPDVRFTCFVQDGRTCENDRGRSRVREKGPAREPRGDVGRGEKSFNRIPGRFPPRSVYESPDENDSGRVSSDDERRVSKSFSSEKYNLFFKISFRAAHVPRFSRANFRFFFLPVPPCFTRPSLTFLVLHLAGLTRNTFVAIFITPIGRSTSNCEK